MFGNVLKSALSAVFRLYPRDRFGGKVGNALIFRLEFAAVAASAVKGIHKHSAGYSVTVLLEIAVNDRAVN